MSTTKRLVSGTIASWARIIVNLITQVLLIPIYLKYWDINTYGIWVAVQALVSVLTTIDRGFVDFLGFEFLKIGKHELKKLNLHLWSGFMVMIVLSVVEIFLVKMITSTNFFSSLIISKVDILSEKLINDASDLLILQLIGWCFLSNTTGLFFRALSVFGYFSRMAWWDFLITVINSLTTLIIVIYGGDLLAVGYSNLIVLFLITLIRIADLTRIIRKVKLTYDGISISVGLIDLKQSFYLSIRYFFENFRQQGIRLILTPLIGLLGLTVFTTIRTIANVLQQGLLTITNPLLPELMTFLGQKNQEKLEVSFSTVWLFLIIFLSPAIFILQVFGEVIFKYWTHGKVQFDPILLMSFSLGILVYALAQPAMAIVIGNNLVKEQVRITAISSFCLLMTLFLFVPQIGLIGGGLSLLCAEIIAAVLFIRLAKQWLNENVLIWPNLMFNITLLSVLQTTISLILYSFFPILKVYILVLYVIGYLFVLLISWNNMSKLIRTKIIGFVIN